MKHLYEQLCDQGHAKATIEHDGETHTIIVVQDENLDCRMLVVQPNKPIKEIRQPSVLGIQAWLAEFYVFTDKDWCLHNGRQAIYERLACGAYWS